MGQMFPAFSEYLNFKKGRTLVRKSEVQKMETFFFTSKFYNRGHLVVDDDEEQWKLLFVRVTRINSPARAHYRPLCEIGFLGTQCIDAQCFLLGFNISREPNPCIYLTMISFS